MADPAEEVPLIDNQPEKMSSDRDTPKLSVVIMFCIIVYVHLLYHIRSLFYKQQNLVEIGAMIVNMEKLIQEVYAVDQNMSLELEQLYDLYLD